MLRTKALWLYTITLLTVGLLLWFTNHPVIFPLALLYAFIIPGSLLLLSIKKEVIFSWESFVLIIGLGVASLMFIALLINTIGIQLGVSTPLSKDSLIIGIGAFSMLMLAGQRRWRPVVFTFIKPSISPLDVTTVIFSVLILLLNLIGTIILNNGGSGVVAVTGYIFLAVMFVWLLKIRKQLQNGTIIWALWLTGLSVLLSGWLRWNYIAGHDVVKEFAVFQLTKSNGLWDINTYRDAYNACLSVNLLPTSISLLTRIPDLLIFKLMIPLLYSLVVPITYILAKSQVKTAGAIMATFFFIAQPPFSIWWWVPIRQQVAILFFALILLVLVKVKQSRSASFLIMIFTFAMIASHYSTAYIAIAVLLLYAIIRATLAKIGKGMVLPPKIRVSYILFMLLSTFLWYSQIAYGFNNIGQFITTSVSNIGTIFSEESQQEGQSIFDRFNIYSKPGTTALSTTEYIDLKASDAQNELNSSQLYSPQPTSQLPSYSLPTSQEAINLDFLRNIFKVGGNMLVSVGVVIVAILAWRKHRLTRLSLLQICAIGTMLIALVMPFFSISYGPDRLYLQVLVALAGSAMIATNLFQSRPFLHKTIMVGFALFVVAYFLLLNRVPLQFVASPNRNINFSNDGFQYDEYSISQSDVEGAKWLAGESRATVPIYGDSYSYYRLLNGSDLNLARQFKTGVIIPSIPRQSYVYQSTSNTNTQSGFDRYEGGVMIYRFPMSFLDENKNMIYNNNGSVLYR